MIVSSGYWTSMELARLAAEMPMSGYSGISLFFMQETEYRKGGCSPLFHGGGHLPS